MGCHIVCECSDGEEAYAVTALRRYPLVLGTFGLCGDGFAVNVVRVAVFTSGVILYAVSQWTAAELRSMGWL